MRWARFFLNDFYTALELEELDERMSSLLRANREIRTSSRARIEALEDGLGRVALLARSLAELCLEKGLVTRDELAERLRGVDLADGTEDRRLHPKVALPGESRPAEPAPSKAARNARTKRRRPYP
jgi:hypothetical protein